MVYTHDDNQNEDGCPYDSEGWALHHTKGSFQFHASSRKRTRDIDVPYRLWDLNGELACGKPNSFDSPFLFGIMFQQSSLIWKTMSYVLSRLRSRTSTHCWLFSNTRRCVLPRQTRRGAGSGCFPPTYGQWTPFFCLKHFERVLDLEPGGMLACSWYAYLPILYLLFNLTIWFVDYDCNEMYVLPVGVENSFKVVLGSSSPYIPIKNMAAVMPPAPVI